MEEHCLCAVSDILPQVKRRAEHLINIKMEWKILHSPNLLNKKSACKSPSLLPTSKREMALASKEMQLLLYILSSHHFQFILHAFFSDKWFCLWCRSSFLDGIYLPSIGYICILLTQTFGFKSMLLVNVLVP